MALSVDLVSSLLHDPLRLLFVVVVVLLVSYKYTQNRKLPPGPFGVPFLGYAPFLDRNPPAHFARLCRHYKTDILSVNSLGSLIIVLNSYDLVRDTFQRRTDLADRGTPDVLKVLDADYKGMINTSGRYWKDHKRFIMHMMRDFGMGKMAAEDKIHLECQDIIDLFRSHRGKAYEPRHEMSMAVSNVINSIGLGRRYEYADPEFQQVLRSLHHVMELFANLPKIMFLSTDVGKWIMPGELNDFRSKFSIVRKFVEKNVEEHKQRYDGTVNDLIDGYLKELEKRGDNDESVFRDEHLIFILLDMFIGGTETTYTTLRWLVLYMATYPDVQEKAHQEIVSVVGRDRLPRMSDKTLTPYTEAVLSEVQRVQTLSPLGFFHTNMERDVEIAGYTIPRDTPVVANILQIHRDPSVFHTPDRFDPSHFYQDGKVVNLDRLMQFGIGRRACAGESLARMELYLFFASWLQNFTIKPAEDGVPPDLTGVTGFGILCQPTCSRVRFVERP